MSLLLSAPKITTNTITWSLGLYLFFRSNQFRKKQCWIKYRLYNNKIPSKKPHRRRTLCKLKVNVSQTRRHPRTPKTFVIQYAVGSTYLCANMVVHRVDGIVTFDASVCGWHTEGNKAISNFCLAKWLWNMVWRRCPEAHYRLLGGSIHSHCYLVSLEDIWLQAHNECSNRQTSICNFSRQKSEVKIIKNATGHLAMRNGFQRFGCQCNSIWLECAGILCPLTSTEVPWVWLLGVF